MHAPARKALSVPRAEGVLCCLGVSVYAWQRASADRVLSGERFPYLQGGIPLSALVSWLGIRYAYYVLCVGVTHQLR
jgi:hypothetical protein